MRTGCRPALVVRAVFVLPVLSRAGVISVLAALCSSQWEQLGSSAGPLTACRELPAWPICVGELVYRECCCSFCQLERCFDTHALHQEEVTHCFGLLPVQPLEKKIKKER